MLNIQNSTYNNNSSYIKLTKSSNQIAFQYRKPENELTKEEKELEKRVDNPFNILLGCLLGPAIYFIASKAIQKL